MKTKEIIVLASALASCLAMNALGQEFGQPVRANEIIGSTIKGSQDQKLGTVKDLAVDMVNGRIVEVVVARGGFLGVDSKLVAVPPENFAVEDGGKVLRLNLPGEKLDAAPMLDKSRWKDDTAQSRVEQVYQYYGETPYFRVEEHPAHNSPVTHPLGDVERASELIGREAINQQDEKLGKVENIVVDLPNARVVEVVIASGGFLGINEELSAVPIQALHFDANRDVVRLNASKEEMNRAPHFPGGAWPAIDRAQAEAVYQAYHVQPYFLPTGSGQSASVNVNGEIVATPEQGTSQADLEITAKIQKEILNADGLSIEARAVKVLTLNGRVTLFGEWLQIRMKNGAWVRSPPALSRWRM